MSDGCRFFCDEIMTPDGLTVYQQEGVGLVVSAAEHNFKLSEWEAEKAALTSKLAEAVRLGDALASSASRVCCANGPDDYPLSVKRLAAWEAFKASSVEGGAK